MNWFEDDLGNWWNLDKATAIYPPSPDSNGKLVAEIEWSPSDSGIITEQEWPRLLAQLRNSQNPWSLLAPFAPAVPPEPEPPAAGLPQPEPADTDPSQNIE